MPRVGGFAVARDGVGDDECFEMFLLLIALFLSLLSMLSRPVKQLGFYS